MDFQNLNNYTRKTKKCKKKVSNCFVVEKFNTEDEKQSLIILECDMKQVH